MEKIQERLKHPNNNSQHLIMEVVQQQQQQQQQQQSTLLYVVQRCWHSGRQQYAPCDLLRLFHTQKEAEEIAYHSAKAFHNAYVATATATASSNNGSNHTANLVGVKTLMLPSYPSHNPQGSSYGFLACGCLFWVRCLKATIVTAATSPPPISASYHLQQQQQQQQQGGRGGGGDKGEGETMVICGTQAYAILTEGVIGGTGNRNSRRGTEICDGRVFGGDALAHTVGVETMTRVKASFQMSSNNNPNDLNVEVRTLPIGKPTESSYVTGDFLNDWPQEVIIERPDLSMRMDENDNHHYHHQKRHNSSHDGETSYDSWGRAVARESYNGREEEIENLDYLVVDCPFEEPIAKRRRTSSETLNNTMDSTMGVG